MILKFQRFWGLITANNKLLLLAFWALAAIVYWPSNKAGFYGDFQGTLMFFEKQSFNDFVNGKGYSIVSLYQGSRFLLYLLISLFGINPLPWFLLFTFLHAFNGVLIYNFFVRLALLIGVNNKSHVFFLGVMLFLITPVAAETVIWKACFHYHTALLLIFSMLNFTLSYVTTLNNRYCWYILGLFCVSTLMLELFFLTPIFVLGLAFFLYSYKVVSKRVLQKVSLRIFVPLVLIWIVYLIVFKLLYNNWVAHYDIELNNSFHPLIVSSKYLKYFLHILFFEFLLPAQLRGYLLELLDKPIVSLLGWILLLMPILIGIRFRDRIVGLRAIGLFCYVLTLLSCVIILPIWFNNAQMIANDRHFYLPSVFLCVGFASLLFSFSIPSTIKYFIFLGYFICSLVVLEYIIKIFRDADKVQRGIIRNFNWQDADTVLLLNLPNNHKGVSIIMADSPDLFYPNYVTFRKDTFNTVFYDVSSYNLNSPYDGAHVTVLDSSTLKVTLNQYGTWWWYRAWGASNYENDLYKVTFVDNGFSYLLQIKQPFSDKFKVLYQVADFWKVVDWHRENEEQW